MKNAHLEVQIVELKFQQKSLTPLFSRTELEAIGIAEGTVRFSIGLESVEDLIKDIEQAVK